MAALPDPGELLSRLRRDLERIGPRTWNGLRHMGEVGRPAVGMTAKQVVYERDKLRLYRYESAERRYGPPIMLVMSLVTKPHVFDLRPGNSMVEQLLQRGFDVWLLDWGVPDAVEAANSFETYCDEYLPVATQAVLETSGFDEVTIFGYCFGAVLSLLFVAGHSDLPVRNLVLLATPVDFHELRPAANVFARGGLAADDLVDETGNVPAAAVHDAIRMALPASDLVGYAGLWQNLHSREFVEAYQAMVGWGTDHIPFPGAVFRQTVEMLFGDNLLAEGRIPLGGREVDLADISCRVLNIVGESDRLVPTACSAPLSSVLTGAEIDDLRLPTGHIGLIVGRSAQRQSIPGIAGWLEAHSERTQVHATT